jgi:hypothetical protein
MFTVELPCKPYVKRFLQINCGEPADLSQHKLLQTEFRRALDKKCKKRESTYRELSLDKYSEIIELKITDDEFNRYGWELSLTDVISFGKHVERLTKLMMHNVVGAYAMVMDSQSAILRFQEEFGFYEDIWNYESIRKDFQRNQPDRVNISREIIEQIRKITLGKLSRQGTICPHATRHYENTSETK